MGAFDRPRGRNAGRAVIGRQGRTLHSVRKGGLSDGMREGGSARMVNTRPGRTETPE
jgi:hypothetical protein